METKHKVLITVLILIIAVLTVSLALFSNKFNKERIVINAEDVQNALKKDINKYGIEKPESNILVYSYIDSKKVIKGGAYSDSNLNISLRIPQINIESEASTKINQEILNKFNSYLTYYDNGKFEYEQELTDVMIDVDYNYYFVPNDEIIFIEINEEFSGSGNVVKSSKDWYIYDVKNSKQLTFAELLQQKQITKDILEDKLYENEKFKTYYNNQYYNTRRQIDQKVDEIITEDFANIVFDGITENTISSGNYINIIITVNEREFIIVI